MSEWIDIGNEMTEMTVAGGVKAPTKWYPHLDVDLKTAPELSGDVGDEVVYHIKGKIVSKRIDEQSKVQCMEVRSIKLPEAKTVKNEADEALSSLSRKRY